MQRYAIIGSPVRHSLSPAMQQAAFDALGIRASYEAIEASSAQQIFSQLRAAQYNGWNVTTPLKEEAVACVDRLTEAASRVNAVNVVRAENGELVGHNTDGAGFVLAVRQLWSARALEVPILILGSGPAARAIALELRDVGAERLFCWSRNQQRAAAIGPRPNHAIKFVISALPSDAAVPAELFAFTRHVDMVFDLNYGTSRSPVENIAAPRRYNGLPLLLHQGVLSFQWWTGMSAPTEAMRSAIYASGGSGPIE